MPVNSRAGRALALEGTSSSSAATAVATDGGVRTGTAKVYLGTVAWALGGIVLGQRERSRPVAAAAAAGLVPVAGALIRAATAMADRRNGRVG